ncbi:hypothetical protein RN001_012003 [Aquatica leii]|uniref:Uncharacterized protein n=1 Tax=Aquatica leii TaxID=1421715 RepID=A0AAN7S7L5_9COLE|nr:hypothetical protein RN001_012003 [Aquatica leii]
MRLNDRLANAQKNFGVNGDVALFLRRMSHAVELNPVPVQRTNIRFLKFQTGLKDFSHRQFTFTIGFTC